MNSCSSSSCHGGAADKRDECVIFSKRDFHSRAFATLTTARSERMAEVLGIESAVKDASCTSCHAPFQTVPVALQANKLDITKGVSCESCHGPAENWIRSHTRPDFAHADRVNAGMRDLKSLYVRANTCVACHQNVPQKLLAAGHPELIFELDGQAVSQPKHWTEAADWNGAQAWLVGQAVALREMSWQLSKEPNSKSRQPDEQFLARENALFWILQKVSEADGSLPAPSFLQTKYTTATVQKWADEVARAASDLKWTEKRTKEYLTILTTNDEAFREKNIDSQQRIRLSRRAERLVLALERLVLASNNQVKLATDSELNELFSLVQSLPDFDPARFADALKKFSAKLH